VDEVADRAAIEKTVAGLNVLPVREDLFTADFDGRGELLRLQSVTTQTTPDNRPGEVIISKEVWGEATISLPGSVVGMRAAIVVKKIRFLTADVAMVDAVGRHPVLLVLKRDGSNWKIASLRILAEK
jgi:hypothetical protein